ncbi:MAG TPA: AMP-binding protein [Solirubrobacterales bacterium]
MSAALARFREPSACAAEILCDRHPPRALALTIVDDDLNAREVTFGELTEASRRVASALAALGVGRGDRVATLMEKGIDLVAAMVGTWRLGAVYVPLFTAFAPGAISLRLEGSCAKAVLVDSTQRPKLNPGPDLPAGDWQVVLTDSTASAPGDLDLATLGGRGDPTLADENVVIGGSGDFVHMFTSGTTGKPKGVVHPLLYAAGWQVYLERAIGLEADDVFWCAADPGWAYGLYTGIVGPLALGRPTILFEGRFDPGKTWELLAKFGVSNFAAAPTVYRSLSASAPPLKGIAIRCASSAGEPLTADVNEWAPTALGVEVHDHFGQTEVGMILANHHDPQLAHPVKAGSMGRATPGWEIAVLDPDSDSVAEVGAYGRLAIDCERSPLMTFGGYHGTTSGSEKFSADRHWYLLGDVASVDADGDFSFQARDDDVIIMAGYRIGPFEIESVLLQHPAVLECAVIGAPDPARGEVLEAFVVAAPGSLGTAELSEVLQTLVKEQYAAHAYPRTVHFVTELPRTPSGKVRREALRSRRRREFAAADAQ